MKDGEIIEVLQKKPRNSDLFEIFNDLPLAEIYNLLKDSDISTMLSDENISDCWNKLFGKKTKDQVLTLIDKAYKNSSKKNQSNEKHLKEFDADTNYGICVECQNLFAKTSVSDEYCQDCR